MGLASEEISRKVLQGIFLYPGKGKFSFSRRTSWCRLVCSLPHSMEGDGSLVSHIRILLLFLNIKIIKS
ncbi:hypothetical protein SAMN05443252_101646 [Bacillus sp. OV322]|nr:hypothetical protein SAMN05443252_101646 [Bacillus sp. OV322]